MSTYKLTYFDIEGSAECVRLTFLLSNTKFEDYRIKREEWMELKPKTPYGQLPILQIDGDSDKMLAQSMAMVRYIGTKEGDGKLYPTQFLYEIEEALGLIDDMNRSWMVPLYFPRKPEMVGHDADFIKTDKGKETVKTMRETWVKDELSKYCKFLETMLTKSGTGWLAPTATPSIADCVAVPALRKFTRGFIDHVPADCFAPYPKVVEYLERFCALPEIQGRYNDGIGGAAPTKEE